MAEAKLPEKIIIGGLSKEIKEKTLKDIFVKYRQVVEVILRKDHETSKLRRRRTGNANGKPSDGRAGVEPGKASRVSYATKQALLNERLRPPPPTKCTVPPRGGRGGRGRNGGNKRLPPHAADGTSSIKF